MRRVFRDALTSVVALITLGLLLAAFDDRVRERLSSYAGGAPSSAPLVEANAAVRSLAGVIFVALRDQSIEHAPLVIFVLAATVLVLFMLRT